MNQPTPRWSPEESTFLLAEYSALRDEILKRIEIQHQLIALALIAAGTFLPFGINTSITVVLLYPVLAMFVAVAWAHSEVRIRQCAAYIKYIEVGFLESAGGWEHARLLMVGEKHGSRSLFASRGIFVGTQVVAWVTAIFHRGWASLSERDKILALIDIGVIVATMFVLRRYVVRQEEFMSSLRGSGM